MVSDLRLSSDRLAEAQEREERWRFKMERLYCCPSIDGMTTRYDGFGNSFDGGHKFLRAVECLEPLDVVARDLMRMTKHEFNESSDAGQYWPRFVQWRDGFMVRLRYMTLHGLSKNSPLLAEPFPSSYSIAYPKCTHCGHRPTAEHAWNILPVDFCNALLDATASIVVDHWNGFGTDSMSIRTSAPVGEPTA